MLSFSGVTFVLFCFVTAASFFVSVSSFLFLCVPLPLSLCMMESTSYVFSFRMVFFYHVTTGWIFDISLACNNSINKKNRYFRKIACRNFVSCCQKFVSKNIFEIRFDGSR